MLYQITREDKGYDSGKKILVKRISEDIPLLKDSYNYFKFTITDSQNNIIDTDIETIEIAQGKYTIKGQPLPNDISLEKDVDPDFDTSGNETELDVFFKKNSLLPQKVKKDYNLHKTITKGSDDKIVINVCEGPSSSTPQANETIGYIEINGKMISRDILKGTDIEITLEMSESRDLKVIVYLGMSDQQFTEVFNKFEKNVPIPKLQDDILTLKKKIDNEISRATKNEDYETADILTKLKKKIRDLNDNSKQLTIDDVTDNKYQYDNIKREIAQEVDLATREKRIFALKKQYNDDKKWCKSIVNKDGNDNDHKAFEDLVNKEQMILTSNIPARIEEAIDEFIDLGVSILWHTPVFLQDRFHKLRANPNLFNDKAKGDILIEAGQMAISNGNYDRLREVNFALIDLLPKRKQQDERKSKIGY